MTYHVSLRMQFLLYAIVAIALLSIDRITKVMALQLQQTYPLTPFLSFDLVLNRGISWGIFHSASPFIFFVITVVIGLLMLGIGAHGYMRLSVGSWVWAELLIISGALGNIVDRVVYGGVIDFIHFSYEGWSFPVFNVADMAVVTGVLLLFWEIYQE